MNAITRWDPFRELDELQGRLSTLFGRAPIRKEGERQEALRVAEWAPLVDITEDPKEYLVKAELPEVKKDEIKIGVQNDVLVISGERKYEKEEKDKKYHRSSEPMGAFHGVSPSLKMRNLRKSRPNSRKVYCKSIYHKSARAKTKSIAVKVS